MSGNLLLRPKNSTYDHLMKIKWLIADATAAGSLARAESVFLVILDALWTIVVGGATL